MRPSLDIDPGLLVPPSQRSGTGRHTLPDGPAALRDRSLLDGVAGEFFSEGDAGTYQGGPAQAALELEDEPELSSVKVVVRTPEMDVRRARGIRVVAGVVGSLVALLAFGAVRAGGSDRAPARVPAQVAAAPAAQPAVAPTVTAPESAAQAKEPAEPPSTPQAIAPREVPPPARQRVSSQQVGASPRAPAALPAAPPAAAAPRPATALPSVANFASRAGDAPRPSGKVPTASFAPQ
ncbi:MAG: hypothetical protein HYZ29_18770 [Myxococcales bacterium]|nr:hypothetical protein [Myxococcales bacterium]